jgi:hypothetical protein
LNLPLLYLTKLRPLFLREFREASQTITKYRAYYLKQKR